MTSRTIPARQGHSAVAKPDTFASKTLILTRITQIGAVALVALLATTSPAWAAAGSGNPWQDFLFKSINTAVLFGVIFFFARKPVAQMFRAAAKELRQGYLNIRADADRISEELAEQKQKLQELEKELKWMTQEAREDGESERQNIEYQAMVQADRIKAHAQQQVEHEMRKARAELQAQLADETAKLAEEMIRGELDDKKRETLVKEFIDQVETGR